jgi:hypothetical protein
MCEASCDEKLSFLSVRKLGCENFSVQDFYPGQVNKMHVAAAKLLFHSAICAADLQATEGHGLSRTRWRS